MARPYDLNIDTYLEFFYTVLADTLKMIAPLIKTKVFTFLQAFNIATYAT